METSLPLSSLVHCLFRCGTRMDRYTNHRGTQHAPMKDVAGLKRLQDDAVGMQTFQPGYVFQDRKSTRLNSSHGYISYAVFCLKKKKDYHHLYVIACTRAK